MNRIARWRHRARSTLLALALLLADGALVTAATPPEVLAALRREAATGQIRLARVPGFASGPLARVVVETPRVTASGDVLGRVRIAGQPLRAVLHSVAPDIRGADSVWVLAAESRTASLGAAVPALRGSIVDALPFSRAALIVSQADVRIAHDDLRSDVVSFYRDVWGAERVAMDLGLGLNLVARTRSRAGTAVHGALRTLGCADASLVLVGKLLAGASLADLHAAKKDEKLGAKLRETVSLRAVLPSLRLAGLPRSFETARPSLLVTGKPGVGIGFRLSTRGPDGARDFDCTLAVEKGELGNTSKIVGISDGLWRRAFGVAGLDLADVRLLLAVDDKQQVSFGMRAELDVGSRRAALAGKLRFHSVTGAVTGGLFEGTLESLGVDDLVAFANRFASARDPRAKPIGRGSLPDFTLRDLWLKIAPFEGDADLGVSEGFALAGRLWALERELAFVHGAIDVSGLVPSIELAGESESFDLGAVALRGAAVDVRIGLTANQRFRVQGLLKLLAVTRRVDVDISKERMWIDTETTVAGIYRTAYHLSSPSSDKPDWDVRARFRNDLTRTLEERVSRQALEWADRTKKKFAKAKADLDGAIRAVGKLDRQIAEARRTVVAKRKKHQDGLNTALANVQRLQSGIDRERATVRARRAKAKRNFDSAKKGLDRAKRAWQQAVRARKKARLHQKPAKRAVEAAKFTAYKASLAGYKVAYGAWKLATKAPVDAAPRVASLLVAKKTADAALTAAKKLVVTFPVDTDPRVASLIVARTTAQGALKVARGAVGLSEKAVSGAARVTAWAAKNNGRLLMVDGAAFDAKLAAWLRGSRVRLRTDVRFLGDAKRIDLDLRAGDFDGRGVVDALWQKLRNAL